MLPERFFLLTLVIGISEAQDLEPTYFECEDDYRGRLPLDVQSSRTEFFECFIKKHFNICLSFIPFFVLICCIIMYRNLIRNLTLLPAYWLCSKDYNPLPLSFLLPASFKNST